MTYTYGGSSSMPVESIGGVIFCFVIWVVFGWVIPISILKDKNSKDKALAYVSLTFGVLPILFCGIMALSTWWDGRSAHGAVVAATNMSAAQQAAGVPMNVNVPGAGAAAPLANNLRPK